MKNDLKLKRRLHDYFAGSANAGGDDQVHGLGGNDQFISCGDRKYDDYFFGENARDTSMLRGKMSEYMVASGDSLWDVKLNDRIRVSGYSVHDIVESRDDEDYLHEEERLKFSDKSLTMNFGAIEKAVKYKLIAGAIEY